MKRVEESEKWVTRPRGGGGRSKKKFGEKKFKHKRRFKKNEKT